MWADESEIYEFDGKKSEILKTGNYTGFATFHHGFSCAKNQVFI